MLKPIKIKNIEIKNPVILAPQAGITDLPFRNLVASFGGKEGEITFLIYTTIYGLISFISPASAILVFGLSYMDVPYKKWLKYIWKFFCAMLVVLLIIFAVLAFI